MDRQEIERVIKGLKDGQRVKVEWQDGTGITGTVRSDDEGDLGLRVAGHQPCIWLWVDDELSPTEEIPTSIEVLPDPLPDWLQEPCDVVVYFPSGTCYAIFSRHENWAELVERHLSCGNIVRPVDMSRSYSRPA